MSFPFSANHMPWNAHKPRSKGTAVGIRTLFLLSLPHHVLALRKAPLALKSAKINLNSNFEAACKRLNRMPSSSRKLQIQSFSTRSNLRLRISGSNRCKITQIRQTQWITPTIVKAPVSRSRSYRWSCNTIVCSSGSISCAASSMSWVYKFNRAICKAISQVAVISSPALNC